MIGASAGPARSLWLAGVLAVLSGAPAASDTSHISFAQTIVPVLKSRCAACHLTGQEPGEMALHPGAAYASLVNAPSVESALLRVKPGEPDGSYLILKLEGTHLDHGGSGVRMPLGATPLDEATLQSFRDWIAQGAREN